MLRFAIFADLHGKFLLPFKLVHHYQILTGKPIDWILQCGDMGAFPTKESMDKATLRHAKNDPDELGFMREFCVDKPEIRQFLETLDVKMLCVRGNHEDHAFLDKLEHESESAIFPIDVYQKVFVCRSGVPITLSGHGQVLGVTGMDDGVKLSKQAEVSEKVERGNGSISAMPKNESCTLVGVGRIGDRKNRDESIFIQDYERVALNKLAKSQVDVDILVTHDKPSEGEQGYGSLEIAELLDQVAFSYHFYGHTGEPYNRQIADNGITESIKVAELEFDKNGKLSEGCMLIVEKNGENWSVEPVPLNQIIQFTKDTWRYL